MLFDSASTNLSLSWQSIAAHISAALSSYRHTSHVSGPNFERNDARESSSACTNGRRTNARSEPNLKSSEKFSGFREISERTRLKTEFSEGPVVCPG